MRPWVQSPILGEKKVKTRTTNYILFVESQISPNTVPHKSTYLESRNIKLFILSLPHSIKKCTINNNVNLRRAGTLVGHTPISPALLVPKPPCNWMLINSPHREGSEVKTHFLCCYHEPK
jgi:hypothetical protein